MSGVVPMSSGGGGVGGNPHVVVVSIPQLNGTLARRALRERRATRQAKSSQFMLSRRCVVEARAAASYAACPTGFSWRSLDRRTRNPFVVISTVPERASTAPTRIVSPTTSPPTSAVPRSGEPAGVGPSPSPSPSPAVGAAAAAAKGEETATNPSAPDAYFASLLSKRGRPTRCRTSAEAGYLKPPTSKQVDDYQSQPFMSDLARRGDVEGLKKALNAGRGMDASNKFGESVVHVACRRGNIEVLRFLAANGGSLTACDDLGRFPLHEVCWARHPRFDIVRVFLDEERRANNERSESCHCCRCDGVDGSSDGEMGGASSSSSPAPAPAAAAAAAAAAGCDSCALNMLLVTDKRGFTPLRYIKEESWPQWRRFLDDVVDEYWPRRP